MRGASARTRGAFARPPGSQSWGRRRLGLDWVAPLSIAAAAIFVYLNGAVFSSYNAVHVDLSINLTAAHAIAHGQDPYGETTLLARAEALHSPTALIYSTLFTSYIQPPTSALAVVPLTVLSWRDATHAYLILNNLFLIAAVALTLLTVRPTVPVPWAIAGAALITAGFSQIYSSFALGQVDASITLLLVLGLRGYSRGRPAVAGGAIAAAAAIKLIPVVLILYFLWKREYRVVAWTLGAGAALLLLSLAAVGPDTYWTYLHHTLPGLMKGSTHYANMSAAGAFNRLFIKQLGFLGPLMSLDEVPSSLGARLLTLATAAGLCAAIAFAVARPRTVPAGDSPPEQGYVLEYYLVLTAGLLVSSVSWEFYSIWLLPLFLSVFLAPSRVLPPGRGARLLIMGACLIAYVVLNYPGGRVGREYFFDVNGLFYHPGLVPGAWVEEHVFHLYGGHLTLVPLWRLAALVLLALTLMAAAFRQKTSPGRTASSGRAMRS